MLGFTRACKQRRRTMTSSLVLRSVSPRPPSCSHERDTPRRQGCSRLWICGLGAEKMLSLCQWGLGTSDVDVRFGMRECVSCMFMGLGKPDLYKLAAGYDVGAHHL
eukprot:2354562-Rhodomonas_salina.3